MKNFLFIQSDQTKLFIDTSFIDETKLSIIYVSSIDQTNILEIRQRLDNNMKTENGTDLLLIVGIFDLHRQNEASITSRCYLIENESIEKLKSIYSKSLIDQWQKEYNELMEFLGNKDIVLDKYIKFRLTPHSKEVFISVLTNGVNIQNEYGDAKFTVLQKLRGLVFDKKHKQITNDK